MSNYLTSKIIRNTKSDTGKKKYTVQFLRSEVRKLIKESNKILYELNDTKKSQYMKMIADEIQQGDIRAARGGENFVQMNVKYMTSKQLQTAYNALQGFISADKESVEYAKRLAERTETMRKKTEKTLGKSISKKAYARMMKMWEKYGDEVDTFGYTELLDFAKKTSRRKESIHDALKRGEQVLKDRGIAPTPGQVLKYLTNERAIESKMDEYIASGMDEQAAYFEALKDLQRQ